MIKGNILKEEFDLIRSNYYKLVSQKKDGIRWFKILYMFFNILQLLNSHMYVPWADMGFF